MNEFRDKLKLQNLFIAFCCFILSIFSFLSAALEAGIIPILRNLNGPEHWHSMWRGMIMGVSVGFLIIMVATLIRNILALKDDKRLKKLMIASTDEREILIWTNARSSAMQIFLISGIVAGIVAGYFSIAVSVTIFACLFVNSIIGLLCMFYYKGKF